VSTTDFFYPLVEDPYLMGEITCCNVLSDLYAMAIAKCDHILMLLAVCTGMSEKDKEISTRMMIQGFNDKAKMASTVITGGQTVYNPFPIIGGVVNSVVSPEEIIMPGGIQDGDVLVLTKPLGTRVAVNLHQWYREGSAKMEKAIKYVSEEDIIDSYSIACESMSTLNLNAAKLMHKYHAHGGTDITGFGILGHLENLANAQKDDITLEIDTMPVIRKMNLVQQKLTHYDLLGGRCAETSGGLLIGLKRENALKLMNELEQPSWIVGRAFKGQRGAKLAKEVQVIDI
jgi:selenide,water dikinase